MDHLGVGFVSLTEALDLATPAGRAMAGLLAVFAEFETEILRERVRAGLAHARQRLTFWSAPHGVPRRRPSSQYWALLKQPDKQMLTNAYVSRLEASPSGREVTAVHVQRNGSNETFSASNGCRFVRGDREGGHFNWFG